VQLGVQSIYDDVLNINKRGHGVKESIQATRLLKDAGLKVDYHMMPGLLGSTKEKDIAMFQELFHNPDFQPDQLKIYPCSIVPYSALEQIYKKVNINPIPKKNSSTYSPRSKQPLSHRMSVFLGLSGIFPAPLYLPGVSEQTYDSSSKRNYSKKVNDVVVFVVGK
jgi:elongator complex protein 3